MDDAAAQHAARAIRNALARSGRARLVAATGTSQLGFLERLVTLEGIDWPNVELFHLDEYIGLPADHPASFRRILRERLIEPTGIRHHHLLELETGVERVRAQVGRALTAAPVDVAFVGIGENSHVAFNDPPADFETTEPYLEVELDEDCRRQQVGEGWFANLDAVPRRALSMSIKQILASHEIIVVVPDMRKARAVKASVEGPITPEVPASILRTHPNVTFYLDEAAASLLSTESKEGARGSPS